MPTQEGQSLMSTNNLGALPVHVLYSICWNKMTFLSKNAALQSFNVSQNELSYPKLLYILESFAIICYSHLPNVYRPIYNIICLFYLKKKKVY